MSTVSTQLTPRTSFSNIKQTPISVQQQSSRKLSSAYTKTPKPSTPFIFEVSILIENINSFQIDCIPTLVHTMYMMVYKLLSLISTMLCCNLSGG